MTSVFSAAASRKRFPANPRQPVAETARNRNPHHPDRSHEPAAAGYRDTADAYVAGFRWGTILMTMVSFALFGLMFTAPQYFQDVRGATPLGSGIRLLPLIGGMLVGMIAGSRLSTAPKRPDGTLGAPPVSAKIATTIGFAVMAAGLALGALTGLGSSTGFAAAWIAITGLGLGLAMPSAMNAAISPLTAERSGSGSALISAVRQVGATIGVAVLGTVLSNGYTSGLTLRGLSPAAVAAVRCGAVRCGAVRSSVARGVSVAQRLGSVALLGEVRTAFIHGMDLMLWTCGGIALVSAVLALAFLPHRGGPGPAPERGRGEATTGRRTPVLPVMV